MSILTTADRKELGVGLGEWGSRSGSGGRIGGLGIVRGRLTCLTLRSGRVSGSRVVEIVYGPAPGLAGHVTTRIGRSESGGRSVEVSLVGDLRLAGLFHDVLTVFVREIVRFLAGQGLVFLEGR